MKGPALFQGEIITKIVKIHRRNLKFFFSRTTGPNTAKFGTKHPLVKGVQICLKEEPFYSQKVDNGGFLFLINVIGII